MNQIAAAYVNALLADASYVKVADGINTEAMRTRITGSQAAFIDDNFRVRTSVETPNTLNPIFGPGFDAVVWEGKSDSPYAGQVYVSMRGTQGGTDIADDITLATRGIPYDQIRDMVNWWLKNTASTTNTNVVQIRVASIPGSVIGNTFALDVPTTGTGLLEGLDPITGVNGHSLGGYLAAAFTRLFGASVQSVSTFNSAGAAARKDLRIVRTDKADDGENYYQLKSCLRPYLLACSMIQYSKTVKKALPCVGASCRHKRSSKKDTIYSVAACARKKDAVAIFRGGEKPLRHSEHTLLAKPQFRLIATHGIFVRSAA